MNTAVLAAIVVLAVGFEALCQVDAYRAGAVRYVPKWAWAGICLISIPLGGIVYLSIGKVRRAMPNKAVPARRRRISAARRVG